MFPKNQSTPRASALFFVVFFDFTHFSVINVQAFAKKALPLQQQFKNLTENEKGNTSCFF